MQKEKKGIQLNDLKMNKETACFDPMADVELSYLLPYIHQQEEDNNTNDTFAAIENNFQQLLQHNQLASNNITATHVNDKDSHFNVHELLQHDYILSCCNSSQLPLLSLPTYDLFGLRESSFLGSGEGDDNNNNNNYDGETSNRVMEFAWDMGCIGREADMKNKSNERQRRQEFNHKYAALRKLIPSPTKNDRASIVGSAIEYIKELVETVNELKSAIEKKRCDKVRNKKRRTEGKIESSNMKLLGDPDQSNGSSRSSRLRRKSKDTEVDVCVIDDEVTIKLVQQKKINCLLFVSKVLEELQLDLHHIAGGHVGDCCSFIFNTKIYEGSSVHASVIANKLIESMDRKYISTLPTSSY